MEEKIQNTFYTSKWPQTRGGKTIFRKMKKAKKIVIFLLFLKYNNEISHF